MKISNQELIDDLKNRTLSIIKETEKLRTNSLESLQKKYNKDTWSALECFEHLNRYSRFYLPEIGKKIEASNARGTQFSSGVLGNYFAKGMLPKEKLNKMKTFKEMNANGNILTNKALDQFLTDQEQLLELLDAASALNLTKIKTAISISKLIKLRLGDTFRVVVYHNQRHLEQAKRAISF